MEGGGGGGANKACGDPAAEKMKMAQRPTIYSISRSKSARYRLNFSYFAEVGYLLAFLPCLRKKVPSGGIRAKEKPAKMRLLLFLLLLFSSSYFPYFYGHLFFPHILLPLLLLFSHDRTRHLSSLRRRLISRETAPEISPRPYSSKGVLFDCEVQSISHKKGRMWEMEALIRGI